jgi:hypothetical protein
VNAGGDIVHVQRRKSCRERSGVQLLGVDAVFALSLGVGAQRGDAVAAGDQQVTAGAPLDVRRFAVDGSVASAASMNGMLKFDIAMFSRQENCRRAPPDARNVDANSYVLSRSNTAMCADGARSRVK